MHQAPYSSTYEYRYHVPTILVVITPIQCMDYDGPRPSLYGIMEGLLYGTHTHIYANMILDRIKFVGSHSTTNKAQWRHHMAATVLYSREN